MRDPVWCALVLATALVLAPATSAGAAAQSESPSSELDDRPVPVYATPDGAEVYTTADWCEIFTEGGFLMTVKACAAQLSLLLEDPESRALPQVLVPDDPTPSGKRIVKKGKDNFETKAFQLADGTYRATVWHKGCAGNPSAFLLPVGKQQVVLPRTVSDGSYIHDLAGGKYALQVLGLRKDFRGKPCMWRVTLSPSEG